MQYKAKSSNYSELISRSIKYSPWSMITKKSYTLKYSPLKKNINKHYKNNPS